MHASVRRLGSAAAAARRVVVGWWLPTLRPSAFREHARARLRSATAGRAYRRLSTAELRATRRTDTAFVFGSGRSLLEIPGDEWRRFAEHDVVSFREFPRQRWVRADYHVSAEVDILDEYAAHIRENPLYRETVFVVQGGWLAAAGNDLVGRRLLPPGARVYRFRRIGRGRNLPPSPTPRRLVHGMGSAVGVTNFAIAMGFRRIVLVGIDLYDHRYFWLAEDEQRPYEKAGTLPTTQFHNAGTIVDMLGDWHDLLAPRGVEISTYNPRSLLAARLPVFRW